jgi:glycosidase
VPAWLNDVTLYHNRGNTTFVGENSYYGDFFGIDGFRIDTMKHVTTSSGSDSRPRYCLRPPAGQA